MESRRRKVRTTVNIPVTITTVLDSLEGRIVDLTEEGAQIADISLPLGTKFHIEYQGQTIFCQCIWSEIDRMGARFPFDLVEGPLHEALLLAQPGHLPHGAGLVDAPAPYMLGAAGTAAHFGRRRAN